MYSKKTKRRMLLFLISITIYLVLLISAFVFSFLGFRSMNLVLDVLLIIGNVVGSACCVFVVYNSLIEIKKGTHKSLGLPYPLLLVAGLFMLVANVYSFFM